MLKKSVQGGKWAGGRIQRFREKYTNADLWLFFIFSILFIVSVIVGLIVCAELAKVIAQGKSWLFPLLIGKVLDATNPGVTDPTKFNYTAPLVMLASLGVAALILGLILKVVDKKRGIGLEEPNIKE